MWQICKSCAATGFRDKVMRGLFTMQPADKLCTTCRGRGWVEKETSDDRERELFGATPMRRDQIGPS